MADDMRIQQAQMRAALGPSSVLPGREGLPVAAGAPAPTGGPAFGDLLAESIKDVNKAQLEAGKAVEDLVSGDSRDVHNTIIAMQKADISFKLMMSVRNKIVDAYKEVLRMQV
jgi:flagellar hook-basal body complex protein FliE